MKLTVIFKMELTVRQNSSAEDDLQNVSACGKGLDMLFTYQQFNLW